MAQTTHEHAGRIRRNRNETSFSFCCFVVFQFLRCCVLCLAVSRKNKDFLAKRKVEQSTAANDNCCGAAEEQHKVDKHRRRRRPVIPIHTAANRRRRNRRHRGHNIVIIIVFINIVVIVSTSRSSSSSSSLLPHPRQCCVIIVVIVIVILDRTRRAGRRLALQTRSCMPRWLANALLLQRAVLHLHCAQFGRIKRLHGKVDFARHRARAPRLLLRRRFDQTRLQLIQQISINTLKKKGKKRKKQKNMINSAIFLFLFWNTSTTHFRLRADRQGDAKFRKGRFQVFDCHAMRIVCNHFCGFALHDAR
jgi:hypothetical protein